MSKTSIAKVKVSATEKPVLPARKRTRSKTKVERVAAEKKKSSGVIAPGKRKSMTNGEIAKPVPLARKVKAITVSEKKPKTIRDSFNMPTNDYALIATLKKRALSMGREVKKSELLRAGIKSLHLMNDEQWLEALDSIVMIKTGRPT